MAAHRPDSGRLIGVRFELDESWQRFGRVVVAGSPLTIFRTTGAAGPILDALETGATVTRSRLVERMLDAGAIHPLPPLAGVGETSFGRDDVTIVTPQFGGSTPPTGRTIVDDGSRPPLPGAAVRLAVNRGPAAARNAGRSVVTTPLIAFVDADVELLDDGSGAWLDPLLAHFDDPSVGLVAPRVAGERGSSIDLGVRPARIRAGTRVSYVPAAAIVVRVAAFDDIGGFDEQLRYGEDVDFVWRLDEAGWRCRYEPRSRVWHRPRPDLAGRLRQSAGYGTSAAPLALRHPRALSPLRINRWTAGAWALIATGHPVAGVVAMLGSAAALPTRLPDVPRRASLALALGGHVRAARQIAGAVRRVWWPLVGIAAVRSRRARLVAAAAVAFDVAATPNDVAYGWGVWTGMRTHRTVLPIVPRLTPWPPPGRR